MANAPVINSIINWLLDPSEPSVRYRTVTELLGTELTVDEHRQHKAAIYESKPVEKILKHMLSDGSWPGRGENISPTFCVSHLAELGVDKNYPPMDLTVSYLMKRNAGKDFHGYPCNDAIQLRALVQAGCKEHPFVQRQLARVLEVGHTDGGYLCSRPTFTDKTKSCLHGSQNTLLLYAELPETWDTPSCKALVDYFLERHIYFKRNDLSVKPRGDLRTIYPFILRQGLLRPLYALSRMGYGTRPELNCAWNLLEQKRTPDGAYIVDWTPPTTYFSGGKRGMPSKWVTLYALLALKYKQQ